MKNKWFCIGTSGATVDGRTIEAQDLTDMASAYSPAVYGARINIEHVRPFWPNSEIGGYGDVLELKTETQNGQTKLFARLDPTEKMISLLKNREKVFTSMEIQRNFAGSGKAYLMGLALTDSPASTGTDMLKFSLSQSEALISQPTELKAYTMNTENTAPNTDTQEKQGLFASIAAKFKTAPEPQTEQAQPESYAALEGRLKTAERELEAAAEVAQHLSAAYDDLAAKHQKLSDDFAALTQKLNQTAVNAQEKHTGGMDNTKSEF
ncbi:MAG: GPO family capsid scaffolding protein [Neisseria sp.]|nr:GPO family capsid scaffolding protein [Neisseria sp.]